MGQFMKQYFPIIVCLLLIASLFYQCNKNDALSKQYEMNTKALTDTVRYYKNVLGSQTATISTLRGDKTDIEKIILEKDIELKALAKEFKTINSLAKVGSKIHVDTISIAFDKPADRDSEKFSKSGNIISKWYSLGYKVSNDSLIISPFNMWTETTTITGVKRKWFLGKQSLVTDVTNTNPYITVTNIKAAEITIPEPWYRKWYIWLAVGIAGGLVVK
jgi:hypothetical protein